MTATDQQCGGRLFRHRWTFIAGILCIILVCPCIGLTWVLSTTGVVTCEITIDSVEIEDNGQVQVEYHYTADAFAEVTLVLDGTDSGSGSSGGFPPHRSEGSSTVLFHVNELHRDGPLGEWTERVLVKEGQVYEISTGNPLDLFHFEEDGELRHGYIMVE